MARFQDTIGDLTEGCELGHIDALPSKCISLGNSCIPINRSATQGPRAHKQLIQPPLAKSARTGSGTDGWLTAGLKPLGVCRLASAQPCGCRFLTTLQSSALLACHPFLLSEGLALANLLWQLIQPPQQLMQSQHPA